MTAFSPLPIRPRRAIVAVSLLAACGFGFVPALPAQDVSEIADAELALEGPAISPLERRMTEQLRSEPHYVFLENGNRLEGRILSYIDGRLTLSRGNAELNFREGQLRGVQLPGEAMLREARERLEAGEIAEALARVNAVYRFRLPFLELLPTADVEALLPVVELNLRSGDPYLAVGAARRLRALSQDPGIQRQLEEFELLGAYRLPIKEEAWRLSREAVAAAPRYGPSALPFYVLAQLTYDTENYEAALRLALEPVVFSSHLSMAYLEHCYALAIQAHLALEEPTAARELAEEMHLRNLPWPELPELAAGQSVYAAAAPEPTGDGA